MLVCLIVLLWQNQKDIFFKNQSAMVKMLVKKSYAADFTCELIRNI